MSDELDRRLAASRKAEQETSDMIQQINDICHQQESTIADLRAKLDEAQATIATLRIKIDAASRRIQRELDYLDYQSGLAGEGEQ